MPKTLKDFIGELSIKAGIKTDDPDLVAFLSSPELEKTSIPDAVSASIDKSLLSIDAARNNHQAIKSHYFKAAWDGLDKTINETMDELELSDEVKAEILKETSSTKRAALLAKKIREIERAASKGGDKTPAELKELRDELNNYKKRMSDKEKEIADLKKSYDDKIKGIHKESKLEALLSSYKTTLDSFGGKVRKNGLMTYIEDELASQQGIIDIDQNGEIVLLKKDGTNFHNENHVLQTPQQFIESVFAKNKLLLNSNTGGDQHDSRSRNSQTQYGRGPNSQRSDSSNEKDDNERRLNSKAASLIEQTLSNMEKTPKANML